MNRLMSLTAMVVNGSLNEMAQKVRKHQLSLDNSNLC